MSVGTEPETPVVRVRQRCLLASPAALDGPRAAESREHLTCSIAEAPPPESPDETGRGAEPALHGLFYSRAEDGVTFAGCSPNVRSVCVCGWVGGARARGYAVGKLAAIEGTEECASCQFARACVDRHSGDHSAALMLPYLVLDYCGAMSALRVPRCVSLADPEVDRDA